MTPDRRSPGLPVFSEPATDTAASAAAPSGVRQVPPVEQGADFRPPPTDDLPEPAAAAHRPQSTGGLTFSDPERQI
ncbi:hypothetical protein GCM10009665_17270 [Kitasatospora nipponensis]|uniref:Uncharacterized protein n=1 Tax=Kitasatospora nipponensis TaxID=258049 RepID=A0ABN1VY55_9ACTN